MTLSALFVVAYIYLTPCNTEHPADVSCRQYAKHLAAEEALKAQLLGAGVDVPRGAANDAQEYYDVHTPGVPGDGSDTDVGCIDDCNGDPQPN